MMWVRSRSNLNWRLYVWRGKKWGWSIIFSLSNSLKMNKNSLSFFSRLFLVVRSSVVYNIFLLLILSSLHSSHLYFPIYETSKKISSLFFFSFLLVLCVLKRAIFSFIFKRRFFVIFLLLFFVDGWLAFCYFMLKRRKVTLKSQRYKSNGEGFLKIYNLLLISSSHRFCNRTLFRKVFQMFHIFSFFPLPRSQQLTRKKITVPYVLTCCLLPFNEKDAYFFKRDTDEYWQMFNAWVFSTRAMMKNWKKFQLRLQPTDMEKRNKNTYNFHSLQLLFPAFLCVFSSFSFNNINFNNFFFHFHPFCW